MSYFFYTLIPLEFLLQFLLDKVSFPISDIVLASLSDKFIGIFIPFLVLLITGRKFLTAEWQRDITAECQSNITAIIQQ
ncbi:hypothetical protein LQF61_01110 [Tetragenococcus koreensis]|uniref:hypothetical protein n=1 Tax=Tetragenococcus koreensis TaxID=290335 RepID=UPI001F1FB701|nr:hypothetical protein [Tetragenococcus koreensis]MCF1585688.1 hypothetical protein [Tetragenococcus koreensis]MCF1615321.1 hypothetical protein [Tetragenococcus koreensis]MCF1618681.1 hypothetical protein [Tetragenococcus koreensis]MCF1625122.1 hypothetical protein [Tetragenococcus koreensis]MCF1629955.1 hypothetical protein [Tetragenococcus koreensis]